MLYLILSTSRVTGALTFCCRENDSYILSYFGTVCAESNSRSIILLLTFDIFIRALGHRPKS